MYTSSALTAEHTGETVGDATSDFDVILDFNILESENKRQHLQHTGISHSLHTSTPLDAEYLYSMEVAVCAFKMLYHV
jgi:hypothetical protein